MWDKNKDNQEYIIFKSISSMEKHNFYDYIAIMLDAWVWMWKSIETAIEKTDNKYFKTVIEKLLLFIVSWDALSKSMKKDPDNFSDYEISVIEAWEFSWTLSKSLSELAKKMKKAHNLKKKITWALTYPLILFLFLSLAIMIVLKYVIPSLMPIFETTSIDWKALELPFATLALINASNFIVNYFIIIIIFIAFIVISFIWYKNTQYWARKIDHLLLSIPLIWIVYKNYILANISSSLWNLIWAWVPTLKVLKLVWKSSWSIIYEDIFKIIIKHVEKWERIAESIINIDVDKFYFPNTFIQMLSVWENTANIQEISKKMYNQYLREVNYSISNLTKWLEPIAILFASFFVLWFAFAIFGAIMKLTTSIW